MLVMMFSLVWKDQLKSGSVCPTFFFLAPQCKEHFWYLDCGWSRHMACWKSLMSDFIEKDGPMVTFEDKSKERTKGFGSIQCNTIEFKDVSYVKCIKHNLISISQMCETIYKVNFSDKEGNITDSKNSILFSAIRKMKFMCLICLFLIRHLLFCAFSIFLCCFQNYKNKSFFSKL